MPLNKYFGGHGDQVMADMKKKYGATKGKQVFYATANKKGQAPKSKMPEGGKTKGNWGDIGVLRQREAAKAGGFTDGPIVKASSKL